MIDKKYMIKAYMLPEQTYEQLSKIKNAVYFIFSADFRQLLYVGQTKNLKQRMITHHANFEDLSNLLGDKSLAYIQFKAIPVDILDLDEVEKYYIKLYYPCMNISHNSPDVIKSYKAWYDEKLLIAYNENRKIDGDNPLTFDEAYSRRNTRPHPIISQTKDISCRNEPEQS